MKVLGFALIGGAALLAFAAAKSEGAPVDDLPGDTPPDVFPDDAPSADVSGVEEPAFFPVFAAPLASPVAFMTQLTGRAGQLAPHVQAVIVDVAAEYAIDAAALAALRIAENGPVLDDGEIGFGVIAPASARKNLRVQAQWAAGTIKNNLSRYRLATGVLPTGADGRYTDAFLTWLSARYAPVGASNDPTNLNANHARNLIAAYHASATLA